MQPTFASPPVALTIAGSDCSSGAGIQADLKTFTAFGVHGLTALTCVVAETAAVVEEILALPPDFVADQVRLLARSFPLGAIKTGMLYSASHIEAVLEALAGIDVPLVVDPVMIASTGDPLIEEDAIQLYRDSLLPRATIFTPNLDEARALLGGQPITRQGLETAIRQLADRFGTSVLLKGGHLRDGRATDILARPGDPGVEVLDGPFIEGVTTHGTGCTYSAALAAGLARGWDLSTSATEAKAFISAAIAGSFAWNGPVGRIEALNQTIPSPRASQMGP